MQEYKLIDKFDGYKLLDRNGQVIYVQTDDVKKQLSLGNVRIYGLKLSESGRLLTDKSDLKQSSQNTKNTFCGINIDDFKDLDSYGRPVFACWFEYTDNYGNPTLQDHIHGESLMDKVDYFASEERRSWVDNRCKERLEKVMKEHNIQYNKYFKALFDVHKRFAVIDIDIKIESFEKYRDGFITVRDPLSKKDVEIQAIIAYAILLYKSGYTREEAIKSAKQFLCLRTTEERYTKADMLNSIKAGDTTLKIVEGDTKIPSMILMVQYGSVQAMNGENDFMFYNYKQRNLMK